jgi:hypothetical protein
MSVSFEQKEKELADRRDALREQLTRLQHSLEITESNLELLREIKPKQQTADEILNNISTKKLLEMPDISVSDAFVEGMKILQQFTKDALVTWVRNRYPALEFSDRSLGRPLRELMAKGQIRVIKPNQGNKTQAVYECKPEI